MDIKVTSIIAFSIVAVVIVTVVGRWADNHDREVMQAAAAYESCVKSEYHMTPIQWYEQNNKYPLCGK